VPGWRAVLRLPHAATLPFTMVDMPVQYWTAPAWRGPGRGVDCNNAKHPAWWARGLASGWCWGSSTQASAILSEIADFCRLPRRNGPIGAL